MTNLKDDELKNNDSLGKLLSDYIIRDSNYAILLTGGWGIGKTYYLKEIFFDDLKERLKCSPIMVSLFGVTSIDEIKNRIFLEIYPLLDNKYVKIGKTVISTLLKSIDISNLYGNGVISGLVDEANNLGKKIKNEKLSLVNLQKLFICFDDVDRVVAEKLSMEEILGFVNSLVENSNVKVVLIADEDRFKSDTYRTIKEKIIANTVHFIQNYEKVYDQILEKLSLSNDYKAFLINKKQQIKEAFKTENDEINLRTLKYFISYFGDIYNYIQLNLNIEDLKAEKNKIIDSLLIFSLMICGEFKKGMISFYDKKELDNGISFFIEMYINDKKPNEGDDYRSKVLYKHYPKGDYHYYPSVYNYLTGGDIFEGSKLELEISKQYNIEKGIISKEYKIYQRLIRQDYLMLSDKEYRQLTAQLKRNALSGKYDIQDYVSIFYYITRNHNVLKCNLDSLLKKILSVIKSKSKEHKYIPSLKEHIRISKESKFYDYLKPIYDAIIEINKEASIRGKRTKASQIEYDLLNNFSKLETEVYNSLSQYELISLKYVNPIMFFRLFSKADNKKKLQIFRLLEFMYYEYRNNTDEDLMFLTELQGYAGKKSIDKPMNNSSILYKMLNDFLVEEMEKRKRWQA
ncbi:P-loop NTPase fold protein [Pedobacter chitinilyticus]|uniref:KAP NTPase domain-containing protein n=1 Tax=Pedobacter chitinilyticus TaxID=2233776 RepID=A0A443Z083_9SPHI|nr:P-loop NTPase fold protein [Pedobacter chitinilyticus]RWU09879.1 hypothetical protein DPV69_00595 [Pedobacter chitinilyticus]